MLHEEKILKFCNIETDIKYKYDAQGRLNIAKLFYHVLGYEITDEIAKVLVDPSNAMLIAATAGSGKTTIISTKLALAKTTQYSVNTGKLITGNKSLALMYNPHNVKDVVKKHKNLMAKLSCIEGVPLDQELNARTLHSFCREWILTHPKEFELPVTAYTLANPVMSESDITRMFIDALETIYEKDISELKYNIEDLKQFYALVRECKVSYDSMYTLDEFKGLNMEHEELQEFFSSLDSMKKFLNKFDFTDTLIAMDTALTKSEFMKERIHTYYDIITVDEVQDFTPLMMSIVEKLQNISTQVICVGDDDQLIYGFKGADLCNTVEFKTRFKNGRINTLSINRRCPSNVLDIAVSVISHNKYRLEKAIKSCREGGSVELAGYSNDLSKSLQLKKILDKIPYDEYEDTVICYRKSISSVKVTKSLLESGTKFHVTNGVQPFSKRIYNDVFEFMGLMLRPDNPFGTLILYKFLPISKASYFKLINYDGKNESWINGYDRIDFFDRDFGEYLTKPKFMEILHVLKEISLNISKARCTDFIKFAKNAYSLFHYNFILKNSTNKELDSFYLDDAFSYFDTEEPLITAYTSFSRYMDDILSDKRKSNGIMLSTFHGLKGLEKSNVIIIDMEEEIFPDYDRIDAPENRTDTQKARLKEDEVRLFYVALTRAKENVYIMYGENNPSRYIDWVEHPEMIEPTFIPEEVKEANDIYKLETSTEEELFDVEELSADSLDLLMEEIDEDTDDLVDISEIKDEEVSKEDKFDSDEPTEKKSGIDTELQTSDLMGGFLKNILTKL